jgi:hypothetical protein
MKYRRFMSVKYGSGSFGSRWMQPRQMNIIHAVLKQLSRALAGWEICATLAPFFNALLDPRHLGPTYSATKTMVKKGISL